MPVPSVKDVKTNNDDTEDPLDRMLKQTGCMELHFEVQVKIFHFLLFLHKL